MRSPQKVVASKKKNLFVLNTYPYVDFSSDKTKCEEDVSVFLMNFGLIEASYKVKEKAAVKKEQEAGFSQFWSDYS